MLLVCLTRIPFILSRWLFFLQFSIFLICIFSPLSSLGIFQEYGKPVYSYSTNPDRRFSSSISQHFKMSPPFASSEGVSASGDRLQSDGVQDTHLLPHSLSTRIRERMCDFALTHSHSTFAYFAYISSYSLLFILSEVL